MNLLTDSDVAKLLKPRKADSHKGTYGHALLLAGNAGKMGAAVIAAFACLRSGVGLLTVNVPREERFILQTALPEAMITFRENHPVNISAYSAIGFGPGLGVSVNTKQILTSLLKLVNKQPIPVVLDADALNVVAAHPTLWRKIPENTVITPHPKEFDRLFSDHKDTEARVKTAIEKSAALNIVIVLKGHQTLIAYKGMSVFNTTGNAGLAKGGSGDALTGIITAFLAQGYKSFEAAQLGVFIHGLAADLTLNEQSMESMLIKDVIHNLGKAFDAMRATSI